MVSSLSWCTDPGVDVDKRASLETRLVDGSEYAMLFCGLEFGIEDLVGKFYSQPLDWVAVCMWIVQRGGKLESNMEQYWTSTSPV